jgi:hypothetical protein
MVETEQTPGPEEDRDEERPEHVTVDDESDATSAAPPSTTPPLPSE